MNLYLYGLGNPLAFFDPLGLFGLFDDAGYFCQGLWQVATEAAESYAESVEYILENPETLSEGWVNLADQASTALADAATQTAINDANGDLSAVSEVSIYRNMVERMFGVNSTVEGLAGVDRASNTLITDPVERVSRTALGISEMAGTVAGAAAPAAKMTQTATRLTGGARRTTVGHRYVGAGEADFIRREGFVPNTRVTGEPKSIFYTVDSPTNSASSARSAYNLSDTPTHRITFDASKARPSYAGNVQGGNGIELLSPKSFDGVLEVFKLNP